MKKFLSLCAMALAFTACSDDDTQFIANEFDGVYKGTLNVEVNDQPFGGSIPQKIYIAKAGENKFKLELKNFAIEGLPIGTISVDDISVIPNGANCSFAGTSNIDIVVGNCDVAVDGDIIGDKIDLDIDVNLLKGADGAAVPNMKVEVDFEGNKLAADQSSEAKLVSFEFDMTNEANKIVTSPVKIDGSKISFSVSETATADQIKALVPTITVSDKATLSPASGSAANFNNPVVYTVTSEDGIVKNQYTVSIAARTGILQFGFDEWEAINYLLDFEIPAPIDILETANRGTAFLSLYGFQGDEDGNKVNTFKSDDAVKGLAAKMVTFDTREHANALVPGITPGALYIGKFNVAQAMVDRLKTTEFGMAFDKKEPLMFKGSYKYTPGEVFVDASNCEDIKVVEGKKDECSIVAVLFEIEKDEDVLTGVDINTSDKRVAVAALESGVAQAEWKSFEIPFTLLDGKTYDPTKKYKITFTCSSSREGDTFKGALGSTLMVDEFEITYKSHAK